MQTPRKVLSEIESLSIDRSGAPPAEHGWIAASIYEAFLSARATLARAEQKDKTSSNKYLLQNIGCLELEEVPTEECPCAPPSGCTWFRTTVPIPNPIGELHAVTTIGGSLATLRTYSYRDWHVIKYAFAARNKAEREGDYYTIKNNYIYILDENPLSVSGIFYDPVEVQRHPQCGKSFSTCDPFLDYPLYVDPSHYQALLMSTYQLLRGLGSQTPFDNTNNGKAATGIEA